MGQPVSLLSYFGSRSRERDWTQQELAEFYRVENTLVQHALAVSTDRGISDEGDPWFVFCRADDEEVIAHIARIGGQYVVVSSAFSGIARGSDFRTLIHALMEAHPLMLPSRSGQAKKVLLHPTALLSALVATAFLISAEKGAPLEHVSSGDGQKSSFLQSLDKVAILSAIAIAATFVEKQVELAFDFTGDKAKFPEHDASTDASVHLIASHGPIGAEQDSYPLHDAGGGAVYKIDMASLPFLGAEGINSSEHVTLAQDLGTPPASPTVGLEKLADSSVAFDAGKAAGHDIGIAFADMVATPMMVPVPGPEMVEITSHQQSLVIGSSSSIPAQSNGSSDLFNLALGSGSSEAFHLVAMDLGSGSLQPAQSLPTIVPLSGLGVAQSLLQLGFSANDAHTISAMTSAASGTASDTLAPLQTSASITAPVIPALVTGPVLPTFDAQANQTLQTFLNGTPQIAMGTDVGGKNLILIDTNPSDMQNHNFHVVEWQVADGSTLTIVGIIPQHVTTA
jgi:hypothetical protein